MLDYKCNRCGYAGSLNDSVPGIFILFCLCLLVPILLLPGVIYICYMLPKMQTQCRRCTSLDITCSDVEAFLTHSNVSYIPVIPYILFLVYMLYSQFITPIESHIVTTKSSYVVSTPAIKSPSRDAVIESAKESVLIELPPARDVIALTPTKESLISSCQGRGFRYYATHDQDIPFNIINKKIVSTCAKNPNAFK